MNALFGLGLRAVAALAPAEQREALIGDLLEERALRPSRQADRWLVRQLLASAWPLAWQRVRRVERSRLVLGLVAAAVAASLVHATEAALWHALLANVPRRAAHAPSGAWYAVFVTLQLASSALAGLASARITRPGGRP